MTREQFAATRRSMVDRLANWDDQKNWQDFFNTYGKLIYGVAKKSGLREDEAQEVVQETLITVAKKIDRLKYDPTLGSFKGWLLQITRWRIADQFRKRKPTDYSPSEGGNHPATFSRIADPAGFDLETSWDTEWKQNLLTGALARVKKKIDARQYQIFDCYVLKQWPAGKVATALRINIGQVYLARHRVGSVLKKEIQAMEKSGR